MGLRGLTFWALCLAVCISVGFANGPKKIVGGEPAEPSEFPHQVSLQYLPGSRPFCGGSILDSTHILTAAHCIITQDTETGPIKRLTADGLRVVTDTFLVDSASEDTYFVKEIITHKSFTRYPTMTNDIAILKLNRAIIFNSLKQPIDLPTSDTAGGVKVMASGYGGTKTLHSKDKLSPAIILQRLPMRTLAPTEYGKIFVESASGTGVCIGDSGGPLTYRDGNKRDQVIGVFSYVSVDPDRDNETCGTGIPDAYTRVFTFLDWIKKHMK